MMLASLEVSILPRETACCGWHLARVLNAATYVPEHYGVETSAGVLIDHDRHSGLR